MYMDLYIYLLFYLFLFRVGRLYTAGTEVEHLSASGVANKHRVPSSFDLACSRPLDEQ